MNSNHSYYQEVLSDNEKSNNIFVSFIKLLRPKQWVKNIFVFPALVFSGKLFDIDNLTKSIIVFFSFCLISSCVYVLNDIVDREKDKKHPVKCKRPIASGIIKPFEASIVAVLLFFISLSIAYTVSINVLIVILLYIINNFFYTFIVKKVIILDVLSISFGFILRLAAGGLALDVKISKWLFLCTLFLSLFMGLGKRRNELLTLGAEAKTHRKNLSNYSPQFLNNIQILVSSSALISYCLYSFDTIYKNMWLTIPFVIYGLFRYQFLIDVKDIGGSPEEILLSDIPFLINCLLWGISCSVIVYF